MLSKNQIVQIKIINVSSDGNGIGKFNGFTVFVPYTAVGDLINAKIVKLKTNYAYAIIDSFIEYSPDRIPIDCPFFTKCGGCDFRHISYDAELQIKQNIVQDAFSRIGKFTAPIQPILPCTQVNHYRNKAQYPVAEINGQAVCGFYSKRSHRIIPVSNCLLQPPEFKDIISLILNYVKSSNISPYNEFTRKGDLRHIYLRKGAYSNQIMLCLVVSYDISNKILPLIPILTSSFPNIKSILLNVNPHNTNVILGKNNIPLFGQPFIYDKMCGNIVKISPHSFYQVNTIQAENLYNIAQNFASLNHNTNLLDLYCGIGTIGLSMARNVNSLFSSEIIPQAVDDAIFNAKINKIYNTQFFCLDSSKITELLIQKNIPINTAILDPPRKGCDSSALYNISKINPQKIVMISCNPATAARDCSILSNLGFHLSLIKPVDLFPNTCHVETVVLITRVKE